MLHAVEREKGREQERVTRRLRGKFISDNPNRPMIVAKSNSDLESCHSSVVRDSLQG